MTLPKRSLGIFPFDAGVDNPSTRAAQKRWRFRAATSTGFPHGQYLLSISLGTGRRAGGTCFGQLDLVAVALVPSHSVQEVVVEAPDMLLKNAVSAAPLALDFENAATSARCGGGSGCDPSRSDR
jgi:hypothetical protein